MGKISPVAAKYIVHATIEIEGVVDRPDVIGAIFGQTEGLLGADLELRELQRSGRIGRIEVNVDTRSGKSKGMIIIPSSLDKAETSIIAAALEVIQRIGPCNAKIRCVKIEDVRVSKRQFVIERAKELLKILMDSSMPDSQELADEVTNSVRVMEVREYGKDRLPAGPAVDDSDEVIIVEGRADVVNLLKHGIKNSIAMNGTGVPQTIIELSKKKTITVFVDGDRGGTLIIKELLGVAEIDFVTRAPDGKEVEEITKKEIHKALRGRISVEQLQLELDKGNEMPEPRDSRSDSRGPMQGLAQDSRGQMQDSRGQMQRPPQRFQRPQERPVDRPAERPQAPRPQFQQTSQGSQSPAPQRAPDREKREIKLSPAEKKTFKELLEDLVGTRGAYILDKDMSVLGKVPLTELTSTLKSLDSGIYAIVFDGVIDRELASVAEKINVKYLVAMDTKVKQQETNTDIVTIDML